MRYDGVIDHRGNRSRRVIVNFYRVFEAPVICVFLIDNGRRSEASARACILILRSVPSALEGLHVERLVRASFRLYWFGEGVRARVIGCKRMTQRMDAAWCRAQFWESFRACGRVI